MKSVLILLVVLAGVLTADLAAQTGLSHGGPRGGRAPDPSDASFDPIRFGDPEDAGDLSYAEPFFPGANYDATIPTPDEILGQRHATRLSHHGEVMECFRRWAALSPRVRLERYAVSYEGRELVWVAISHPDNIDRLDGIRDDLVRLTDPRLASDAEADELVDQTPPVAWMGYSIHGDELSGSDAAVAFGYHLIASTDADVEQLLRDVVIVIDPVMNPDGRERIISQVEQGAGYVPSLDLDSAHRGRWPWGRGNHNLFDMNRDWMAGVHPETRGRWRAARSFRPALFVDAHEMGSLDTYLFYPQAAPLNPHGLATLNAWHQVFAASLSSAFDTQGWGYYTREWADGWGPFYSDAWASLNGAVGILYEQASTNGSPLRRASGDVLTYREAVHHHVVASDACVRTLAAHGSAMLADLRAHHAAYRDDDRPARSFVIPAGAPVSRVEALRAILLGQGIEAFELTEAQTATAGTDTLGRTHDTVELPVGSLVVPLRQPAMAKVASWLGFDPRMDAGSLLAEREQLERKGETKIYDVTAWSLAHAFGLEALWVDEVDVAGAGAVTQADQTAGARGTVVSAPLGAPAVSWAVDGADDAALRFAVQAMELGLAVHSGDEAFSAAGRAFARGSLLVRAHENAEDVGARVAQAARLSGATVWATATGRSPDLGPDLGGQHFTLLARPRVALVGNSPVAPDDYGHAWFELDHQLGLPVAMLDAQSLGAYDLRRYNVVILPPGAAGGALKTHAARLRRWVEEGGTLIAMGSAATGILGKEFGLSAVQSLRSALPDRESYAKDVARELAAREVTLDYDALWQDGPADAGDESSADDEADADSEADSTTPKAAVDVAAQKPSKDRTAAKGKDAEREDAWKRRFSPRGIYVRGLLDGESWLTVGAGDELPVFFDGSHALLSRAPVTTPVRLSGREGLRLSGLLWPEAAERIADSAWLTREAKGRGQVILFVSRPVFRGYSRGTARLFGNAVVYGPGLGASQPLGW